MRILILWNSIRQQKGEMKEEKDDKKEKKRK